MNTNQKYAGKGDYVNLTEQAVKINAKPSGLPNKRKQTDTQVVKALAKRAENLNAAFRLLWDGYLKQQETIDQQWETINELTLTLSEEQAEKERITAFANELRTYVVEEDTKLMNLSTRLN